jgi:hypothetical protein
VDRRDGGAGAGAVDRRDGGAADRGPTSSRYGRFSTDGQPGVGTIFLVDRF